MFLLVRTIGVLLLCCSLAFAARPLLAGGLEISVAADIVGAYKHGRESSANDRLDLREAEVMFYAPVDHLFDARLSVAAHQEQGMAVLELHEGYISSSKLIPRSQVKVGQFFLGIGRLNRFHRHDWPFVSAPMVHRAFIGEEGVNDTGVEYAVILPLPFYLGLTTGVGNGWTYGHAHDAGQRPLQPTHYLRLATYADVFGGGAETGLSYLARKAADKELMRLFGLDFVAKWRQAAVLTYQLQSELWLRQLAPDEAKQERVFGAYLYPQMALSSAVSFGLRFDYMTNLTLKDAGGKSIANRRAAVVPTLTYKASEFSTLRLAYTYEEANRDDRSREIDRQLELQTVFIIGAHPAHEF